jgi:hypothetical protein
MVEFQAGNLIVGVSMSISQEHQHETPYFELPHFADQHGVQKLYKFENGRGAGVVRWKDSEGYLRGLWELATIIWTSDGPDDGEIDESMEIRGDMTEADVDTCLAVIGACAPVRPRK